MRFLEQRLPVPLAEAPAGGSVRLDMRSDIINGKVISRNTIGPQGTLLGFGVDVRRGVFDHALKLRANEMVVFNSTALDFSGSVTIAVWMGYHSSGGDSYPFVKVAPGPTSDLILNTYSGNLQFYTSGGGWFLGTIASVPLKGFSRFVATGQSSGTIRRLFQDGLQINRDASWVTHSGGAGNLYLGYGYLVGKIDNVVFCSGAWSPQQVYNDWLQGARRVMLFDDLAHYNESLAEITGGMLGPFRIATAGANGKIYVANNRKWIRSYGTSLWGTMDSQHAYGTWRFRFWLANDALDSFVFLVSTHTGEEIVVGATADYAVGFSGEGAVVLTRYGTASFIISPAGTVAEETEYEIQVTRRINGQWTVYLKGGSYPDWTLMDVTGGSGTNPAVENTTTTSKCQVIALQTGDRVTDFQTLQGAVRPTSYPWEFSSGTWAGIVDSSLVFHKCLTAGVSFIPKDLDWKTCAFDIYKGADGNVLDVLLAVSEIGGTAATGQNGYVFRVSSDERLQLVRVDSAVETVIGQTAASSVANTTRYSIRVLRTDVGVWSVYILGGVYTTWTFALGTITDNTYTTSNYYCLDMDASDRVSASTKFSPLLMVPVGSV